MRRLWLIFTQAVTVALAVLFVVGTLKPAWLAGLGGAAVNVPAVVSIRSVPESPAAAASGAIVPVATTGIAAPAGYSIAARSAAPAVVSVSASKRATRGTAAGEDPWFRYFQGGSPAQTGVGSGVIVSPEGYLLTNNHVIEGATDVEVRLSDGREASARVVGTDPDTDLAVLKVELDRLPAITLGDIDALQVGDIVLAIGNPFNVGQTVTSGIVSALGRSDLQLSTFENYIQTDAAINPGNSGGALVDVRGHLVGINTAIYSRSGGSMGIGFAIPVDTARQVMESLIKDGRVIRGWIGVEPRDLTPEFAANFKLPIQGGVLITGVVQNGPAGTAGMRPGDVVTSVAGQSVASTSQLLKQVAALSPGREAQIGVQRGQESLQLTVVPASRPKPARRPQ